MFVQFAANIINMPKTYCSGILNYLNPEKYYLCTAISQEP